MKQTYEKECQQAYKTFLEEVFHQDKILNDQKTYYENVLHAQNEKMSKTQSEVDKNFKEAELQIRSKVRN